jgi:D-serine dehydratase
MLCDTAQGRAWLQRQGLAAVMPQATHIVWTTGGLFVPEQEYRRFLERGAGLERQAGSAGQPRKN